MANNDPYGGGYQGYAGQSYAGYGSDINSIRNRLAMAQLQAGMSTDPIRSKWQGVARLSDALFGSLALQRASEQGAAGAVCCGFSNRRTRDATDREVKHAGTGLYRLNTLRAELLGTPCTRRSLRSRI